MKTKAWQLTFRVCIKMSNSHYVFLGRINDNNIEPTTSVVQSCCQHAVRGNKLKYCFFLYLTYENMAILGIWYILQPYKWFIQHWHRQSSKWSTSRTNNIYIIFKGSFSFLKRNQHYQVILVYIWPLWNKFRRYIARICNYYNFKYLYMKRTVCEILKNRSSSP